MFSNMNWANIRDALVGATLLAMLTTFWNWASQGGVLRVLDGVTRQEVVDIVRGELLRQQSSFEQGSTSKAHPRQLDHSQ
jgi:hypothetical protein